MEGPEFLELVYEKYYEHTQNPLFAWDMIRICNETGRNFPDWVNAYLFSVSDSLLKIDQVGDGDKKAGLLSKALILRDGNCFSQYQRFKAAHEIYQRVCQNVKNGNNVTKSIQKVKDTFETAYSDRYFQNIYYAFKRFIETLDPKHLEKLMIQKS
jgi:hypothetical protein